MLMRYIAPANFVKGKDRREKEIQLSLADAEEESLNRSRETKPFTRIRLVTSIGFAIVARLELLKSKLSNKEWRKKGSSSSKAASFYAEA